MEPEVWPFGSKVSLERTQVGKTIHKVEIELDIYKHIVKNDGTITAQEKYLEPYFEVNGELEDDGFEEGRSREKRMRKRRRKNNRGEIEIWGEDQNMVAAYQIVIEQLVVIILIRRIYFECEQVW